PIACLCLTPGAVRPGRERAFALHIRQSTARIRPRRCRRHSMTRYYGIDYDPRSGHGGRSEYGFPGPRDSRAAYRTGTAWSRPEINTSLGYEGDWDAGRALAYDFGWYAEPVEAGAHRTHWTQQWGSRHSAADRVKARELMTENPEVVTPDTSLVEV